MRLAPWSSAAGSWAGGQGPTVRDSRLAPRGALRSLRSRTALCLCAGAWAGSPGSAVFPGGSVGLIAVERLSRDLCCFSSRGPLIRCGAVQPLPPAHCSQLAAWMSSP